MVISNWTSADGVAEALNVVPPSPSRYAQFLKKFMAGMNPDKPSDSGLAVLQDWVDRKRQSNPSFHEPVPVIQ